jgi:hypothetical protein
MSQNRINKMGRIIVKALLTLTILPIRVRLLLVEKKCYLNILVIKLLIVESTAGVTVNSLG